VNEKIWWYLSRSSGIVALVLLVATVVWGILLSTRVLKPHDRPAWLLDLHKWLGGSALVMTVLHMLGLFLDGYIDYGFTELLVPATSDYRPMAVAVGVLSFYVLVAVQLTSHFRTRLSKRMWHSVHMLSYALVWGAAIHAGMAGTDVVNRAYQVLALLLTVIAVSATIVRVLTPGRSRPAQRSL
jgi:DMSO/TMAO reductase YedYZ heme-binding membrane subunit